MTLLSILILLLKIDCMYYILRKIFNNNILKSLIALILLPIFLTSEQIEMTLISILIPWLKIDCMFYILTKIFNNNILKSLITLILLPIFLTSEQLNFIFICCCCIFIADLVVNMWIYFFV